MDLSSWQRHALARLAARPDWAPSAVDDRTGCQGLVTKGLAEKVSPVRYRITPAGRDEATRLRSRRNAA